ncbi:MAG: ferric reductase-like transmembrane domain-containing protein [Candidatus Kerfeldbacteria bacterium]|nr:ferric reductase-like transmembrane domain-containing protein [Candidatus Kerfeldbacteria bacterium]
MKYIWLLLYGLITVTPAVILWQQQPDSSLYTLAKVAAVTGFTMLVLQLVLAARWPWIERWYGQDRIMRFHRRTGTIGTMLIVLHPVLLYSYYGSISSAVLLDFLQPQLDWKLVGQITLLLLLAIVALALWTSRFKLPYHWWKKIHLLVYLVIIGGFVHSFFLGSDIIMPGTLRTFWWILAGLASAALGYRHVWLPLWLRWRRHYVIDTIQTPAKGVHSITLLAHGNERLQYTPGQFIFIQFLSAEVSKEWHPFTISSSPTEPNLTISIKESGDWTSTLKNLMPGEKALIEGPFGRFSSTLLPEQGDLVYIAGGIGITPLRSMVRYLADTNSQRAVTVFYSGRTRHDLAFYDELKTITSQHPNIRLLATVTDDQNFPAEHSRIDVPLLKKHLSNNLIDKDYFVCGPPPMMRAIKQQLLTAGVAKHQIHTEEFSLK